MYTKRSKLHGPLYEETPRSLAELVSRELCATTAGRPKHHNTPRNLNTQLEETTSELVHGLMDQDPIRYNGAMVRLRELDTDLQATPSP